MGIKILEIHIDHGLPSIPPSPEDWGYKILVRNNHTVFGWLTIYGYNKTGLSAGALQQQMALQLDHELVIEKIRKEITPAPVVTEQPVSIIVCTRNRAVQLEECLKTIRKVDYQNFEVVVVDNAPDDDSTKKIAEKYNARYVMEERKGLDRARNKGILEARHEIIAFTDDDVRVDTLWLQSINRNFSNPDVMCVTGYVAPVAIDTWAQEVFELKYGGMGHGYNKRFIRREKMPENALLWASGFGIGANMSFRKKIFENIGYFDPALDLGTASNGGGDIEIFHRLVSKGYLLVYDPGVFVWHQHRENWKDLEKQVYNNGRGMGCFLMKCLMTRSVRRRAVMMFWLRDWWYRWALRNLLSPKTDIPQRLALKEILGMMSSPAAYFSSLRQARK